MTNGIELVLPIPASVRLAIKDGIMSVRSTKLNLFTFSLLFLWLCHQCLLPGNPIVRAQSEDQAAPVTIASTAQNDADHVTKPFIRLVRQIETARLGIRNPAGLAFSPATNLFHLLSAQGTGALATTATRVAHLQSTAVSASASAMAEEVDDPINMTFDSQWNRLLFLNASSAQLLVVPMQSDGKLAAQAQRYTVQLSGLQNPQGMTIDPLSGQLYLLDAAGPRLLQLTPDPAGDFAQAQPLAITLPATIVDPRGLAWEPGEQQLYILSPSQQMLYTLNTAGEIVATRDVTEFGLDNPQAMLFAPSGDLTDDPEKLSLYIADAGQGSAEPPNDAEPTGDTAACTVPATCPNQLYLPLVAGASGALVAENTVATDTVTDNTVVLDEVIASADTHTFGALVELSLAAPVPAAPSPFPATLVKSIDLATITPPSPDPSGITYIASSNTFLISDGEVEETVNGITHFQGANLWEVTMNGTVVRTANITKVPPTVAPVSNEIPGVAWNPYNGHYYFSDDDTYKIFDLAPGTDGLVGTADDLWFSFDTQAVGNLDPEGVAYDNLNNYLFVADGLNEEIYQYTLNGTLVNHFDVEQYGVVDPESVEFNPDSGTLLILSNHVNRIVIETTTSGALLRTINVAAAGAYAPAGLAYAPASDGSGAKRYYIVDRGIDNNVAPALIDGKLYEVTAPTPLQPGYNIPPAVNAGPDQAVVLPNAIQLSGSFTDDGQPNPPGAVTTFWSQISGPGTATFSNSNALATTVNFSLPGTYILRLNAHDGEGMGGDNLTVVVTGHSNVTAFDLRIANGEDDAEENTKTTVTLNSGDLDLTLDGGGTTSVINQWVGLRFPTLPVPPEAVIVNAHLQFTTDEAHDDPTQLTIQGEATDNAPSFVNEKKNLSKRARTTASVTWTPPAWTTTSEAGPNQRTPNLAALLQEIIDRPGWANGNAVALLIGGSGQRVARAFEDKVIHAPLLHVEYITNQAPVVTAGPDQTIALPIQVALNGTVADDDLPLSSTLLTTWTQVSGPAAITFGDTNLVDTTASFTVAGVYVLRLTATDGALTSSDDVMITVTVNEAPLVNAGPAQSVMFPYPVALDGTVSDDGFPKPPALTTTWSKVSGPGNVTFGKANAVDTTATFSTVGVYVLRLSASDGALNSSSQITITVTPQLNLAPVVEAGPNQTLALGKPANLDGTVTDDGLPSPTALVTSWSKVSGPGNVTFGSGSAVDTTATFSAVGVYVLRLTASDGALQAQDEVTLIVTTAPVVNAGPDQTLALPNQATLDGTVSDDGLPTPTVVTTWSKVSGPGNVTFDASSAVDTTAAFSAAGTYVLRLTANDGAFNTSDELTVTVTDLIFADDFSSGTLSAWSGSVTDGGDLSVSPAAGQGPKRLEALIDDNNTIYVRDDSPADEPRYRMRFYFHPHNIEMAANDMHQIFSGRTAAGTVVLQIELRYTESRVYQVRALILGNSTTFTSSGWVTINNAPHALELDWRAASAPGASNGGVTFWIDGVQKADVTGIRNDSHRIDSIRLGAGSGIDNGTRGAYYFDAFVSTRQSYIGP